MDELHCPDCDHDLSVRESKEVTPDGDSYRCGDCGALWLRDFGELFIELVPGRVAPTPPRISRARITPGLFAELKEAAAQRAGSEESAHLDYLSLALLELPESGIPATWKEYDDLKQRALAANRSEQDFETRFRLSNAFDYYLAELSQVDACKSWFTNPRKHRREGR